MKTGDIINPVDMMTGHPPAGLDQLPVAAPSRIYEVVAGVATVAALYLGSTAMSPGVVAPRAESSATIAVPEPAGSKDRRLPNQTDRQLARDQHLPPRARNR